MVVGCELHKLALSADDLPINVSSPTTTLPNVLQEFQHYGALNNYKVNTQKSELLNISLPPPTVSTLRHIKYLGVMIPTDLSQLFTHHFSPLLKSLTEDLSRWAKGSFPGLGKWLL